MTRKRTVLAAAALAAAVLAVLGGGAAGDQAVRAQAATNQAYFGWVLGTRDPTGVAVDAEPAAADGTRTIRAYVCDGFGPPQGKAIWFLGAVDVARVNRVGEAVTLRSASKRERLRIEHLDEHVVRGSFIDRRGHRRQFVASLATGGAGIYDVTLGEDLRYTGTSTTGDRLDAQAQRSGAVEGTITTAAGEAIAFRVKTLSLAPVAELRRHGFRKAHRRDRRRSLQPGQYVAVIAPGGSYWLGRSGDVRGGSAGNNIIGLDKAC